MTLSGTSFFGIGTLVSSGTASLEHGTNFAQGARADQYTASILLKGSNERSI